MERLTYTSPLGSRVSKGACADVQCGSDCDACAIYKIISKLWEYEETGLTPEEIKETVRQLDTIVNKYGLYHAGRGDAILELLTACKSGRLALLPCPIGSAVYVIGFKSRHGKTESFVNTGRFRFSDMEKLGVTVFLTRREAEEAIAKTEKALTAVGL